MSALESNPLLFKNFELKYRPSGISMFLRMMRSVYYSVVLILMSWYLNQNGMTFINGTVNDLNGESYTVFIALTFATSLEFFLH